MIGRFAIRLSRDGHDFGRPVAYGRWQANPNLKRVGWVPASVRAVRLTVLSASAPGDHAVAVARLVLAGALRSRPPHVRAAITQPTASAAATSTSPSAVGKWGPTIAFPMIPVAAALIPGNKLVV